MPQPTTLDPGAARILYVEDNLSNLELVESILWRSSPAWS